MKICKKCNKEKEITEYYTHPRMLDGHLNICKKCTRERVLKHRKDNIDKIREYDRYRRKVKNMTDDEVKKRRAINKKYKIKNKLKIHAHALASSAEKRGKIIKKSYCEDCLMKESEIYGVLEKHHEDYYKPLDVIWLCSICHSRRHKRSK